MNILHIDAGITPESVSRRLSAEIVQAIVEADPRAQVARRDLGSEPIPHLDGQGLADLADSAVLTEFLTADVVVVGAPMYNLGIASQLKAWFDRVLVAGKTFRYGAAGLEGLAGPKKVIVVSARGGDYAPGTPGAAADFQEPYIRSLFAFIGIHDITVVRAEGVAMGPERRDAAIAAAIASGRAAADALAQAA
jgi:FMN-dependent NADH-azoreductase